MFLSINSTMRFVQNRKQLVASRNMVLVQF